MNYRLLTTTSPMILALALGVSVATLTGCGAHEAPAAVARPTVDKDTVVFPKDSPQLKTLVSVVSEIATEDELRLSGRLAWNETRTVRVFAPVGGRILHLVAQPGQKVKAGDVLATLSSPDFGQVQSDAAKATADFMVADKALERARELNAAGIVADKDFQQAQADHVRASAERNRTQAQLKAYGGSVGAEQQFSLRAPIAGIVVERNANPGQEVRPDQSQPGSPALFVISDPTHLWVNIELPEAALSVVKAGMPLDLKVAALGDEVLTAKIEHVADYIDAVSRTTRARAVIDNKEHKLKSEMFVNAHVKVTREAFIRIPAAAMILLGKIQYVFVDEGNGRYRRQVVVTEEAGFGQVRVKEGVKNGEKVVTDGALLLQQILATTIK